MRNLFLLLLAVILVGCEASTPVDDQDTGPLVITSSRPAIAGSMTRLTAKLTPPDSQARYLWQINGETFDSTNVMTYNFPSIGEWQVICHAIAKDGSTIAGDTITVTVVAPNISLDMANLRRFSRVYIQLIGEHYYTTTPPGTSELRAYRESGAGLSADGKQWIWQGNSVLFDNVHNDTVAIPNTTPILYRVLDSTQHLSASFEGNVLKSINLLHYTGYAKYTADSTFEDDNHRTEFDLKNFVLIHQSADSIVFTYGGPTLKDHLSLKDRSQTQRLGYEYNNIASYDSTAWSSQPIPYARVLFYK
jgi:hypothetical protein